MISTLDSERVQAVLSELRAVGEAHDDDYKRRVHATEAELDGKLYGRERAELGVAAPLAITPEVGRALYALTLAARPARIVEFGTSLGCSTIYLASALRDVGAGSIITTELVPEKADRASENFADAGLGDLVEIRVGDALDSLASIDTEIGLLFLDGSNDLYVPVLELLAPHLSTRALVVADMSPNDPHHVRYREHVQNRYPTVELPLDAGLVVSAVGEPA